MYIKKTVIALLLVVALLLGASLAIILARTGVTSSVLLSKEEYEDYQHLSSSYRKLDNIKESIEEKYYIDADSSSLVEGAYYGMVDALNDPYSEYVSAKDYENYLASMLGEYSGVGMSFYNNEDGVLEVVQVYRNSPAQKAGMQPGDIITEVDGVAFSGSQSTEAASAIRGNAGTKVQITYYRDGVKDTVTMTRAQIQIETVSSQMLEDNIGYIQIESFESATDRDFRDALNELTDDGARALIIDLRNNGGGLVDVCIRIADMLMEQGTVVYTEDHDGNREFYRSEAGRTALPYVLLVNEYTASASEILAAGVKDNNEGKIIGTTTYGKGIIQSLFPILEDGSALKLTIMQYYSPSGNTIHKVGITPDYEVKLVEGDDTDYQLLKAIEVLK